MDTEDLFRKKRELNQFLMEHPELVSYQEEIERRLGDAGSQHNRMVVLNEMIQENLHLLLEKLRLIF